MTHYPFLRVLWVDRLERANSMEMVVNATQEHWNSHVKE